MTIDEAVNTWMPVVAMGVEDMPEIKEAVRMSITSLEAWGEVKAEIEDYMERKWEQLSDSDKVIVTGVTTIDDWKFHMAESTLDIIDRHLQE